MENFLEIINSKYVYVPFMLWFSIQLFKLIYDMVTTKKFNFKRIVGAGGMPSSHSAVVCSLAILIGRSEGFSTAIFGLALMLALIVMYDAAGVRRAAGKQATLLNKLVDTPGLNMVQMQEKLVEVLGHTPKEVFIGALLGIIVGAIM